MTVYIYDRLLFLAIALVVFWTAFKNNLAFTTVIVNYIENVR